MRITNRRGVFFITLWKKSVYGRTLTDIEGDDDMVGFFADNITQLIRSVLGLFRCRIYSFHSARTTRSSLE